MITHSSNQEWNWHDEIDISKDVMCMLFLIVEDQLIVWKKRLSRYPGFHNSIK